MFGLPPVPSWDALHPLIVHFPIALLLTAPVFLILGLVRKSGRGFLAAALILMALGTAATYVAVPTGEAAAELADRTAQVNAVIETHESLAETTRTVFTALTVIFAVILLGPALFRKRLDRAPALVLNLAFLVFYAAGSLVLVNTAHNGGRLVHEFGVQALIGSPADAPLPVAAAPSEAPGEADDD